MPALWLYGNAKVTPLGSAQHVWQRRWKSALRLPLLMQWTAPATGIAICPIPTALEERFESPPG